MISSIRYNKDAGNSKLYVRLRNGTGYFWDFISLQWTAVEVSTCEKYMSEYQDADPDESLYLIDITVPPGGPFIQEVVLADTGVVIGSDSTSTIETLDMDQMISMSSDMASLLNRITDARAKLLDKLVHLDTNISEVIDGKIFVPVSESNVAGGIVIDDNSITYGDGTQVIIQN